MVYDYVRYHSAYTIKFTSYNWRHRDILASGFSYKYIQLYYNKYKLFIIEKLQVKISKNHY